MQTHEYKVVPAPNRGEKGPGLKTSADRYAGALATLMNTLARDGWEYLRADTLPSDERTGFTKRTTVYHSMLVFCRPLPVRAAAEPPRRQLTTEAPTGKAPAIAGPTTTEPIEGEAPKLGTLELRP